jgi:hypothetical protein
MRDETTLESYSRLWDGPEELFDFVEVPERTGSRIGAHAELNSKRLPVMNDGGAIDDKVRPSLFDSRPAQVMRTFYRYVNRPERERFLVGHIQVPQKSTVARGQMHPHDLRANIVVNPPGSYGTEYELHFPGGALR